MVTKISEKGRYHSNKGKNVFVASGGGGQCPTINVIKSGKSAKFKDDYSKGFKTSKALAKFIFR